ncbi:uncharacterized protein LDX57_003044 [Aspergillus melleus]|uniref:uncharacterized protein n=1 Tax=Aspergillus melleus TaxID=138277 RepID=UPI001E8D7302|nr:uncharacterized protein LDX57_003044 [Aspergillus melleus]KAH8425286.1 hypothetical protein LDX57_003044 [Aspergillus melleus]
MEKTTQFQAIWDQAKERYRALTDIDLDDPSAPHPASTADLVTILDTHNREFKHFREKRSLVFDSLQSACKPIELVGNLAAGAASMAFPPSSLCFGAAMYLVNAAHGVSASYDAIADLFVTLKDFLVRLQVYNREDLPSELQAKLAEILATLLEIFARSTKVVRGGSLGRVLHFTKNILLGRDETLQGLVGRLEKQCQSEHRLVGAETLTESKKTGKAVAGIAMTVTETSMAVQEGNFKIDEVSLGVQSISVGQEEFRQEMREDIKGVMAAIISTGGNGTKDIQNQEAIKKILEPSVSPLDIYNDIAKRRVPGTGDWIRTEQLFRAWTDQENPVLWVSGNPGSGKSFLSENIISFLQEMHPQGVNHPSRTSIGYFFFKDSNPETRSFHRALRDLAYQIYQNDPLYQRYIQQNCHSPQDVKTIQSAWRTLFLNYFADTAAGDGSVFLVFDGVDEAFQEDRQTFLGLLSDLRRVDPHSTRIHIVLVGRPEIFDDLADALDASLPTIHVDWRKNSSDIAHYVETSIKKSRVLSRAPKALRDEIEETLTRNAQGMFVWVDLMLRELSKKTRASSIRDALTKAPRGLDQMLRHVLENFSTLLRDEEPDDLNEMLAWVTCAQRPLTLGELDTLLKIRSAEGDGVFNLENMLRKQYASFFTLVREDGLTTADLQGDGSSLYKAESESIDDDGLEDVENETDFDSSPTTTNVIFCHASIGDFFRDPSQGKVSAGEGCTPLGVHIVEARVHTLKFCLEMVCGLRAPLDPEDSESMEAYALNAWDDHLLQAVPVIEQIAPVDKQSIAQLLLQMLRDEAVTKRWLSHKSSDFVTRENLDPIIAFLTDRSARETLDEETLNWLLFAIENPGELYRSAATLSSKEWLGKDYWAPEVCVKTVLQVIRLLDPKAEGEEEASNKTATAEDEEGASSEIPTVEEISRAAEWLPLEQSANWHRRLAMCLRAYGHHQASINEFARALELDDKLWTAREGMAKAYMEQRDYTKAIELFKYDELYVEDLLAQGKCSEEEGSDRANPDSLSDACEEIAACYLALSDPENALLYYRKAFENSNRRYSNLQFCVQLLDELNDENFNEIITLLKTLEDDIEGDDITRMTEFLFSPNWSQNPFLHTCVAAVAHKAGEIEWLENAYQTAISAAKRRRLPVIALALDTFLAEVYSKYSDKEDQAMDIWKRVMNFPVLSSDASHLIRYYKRNVESSYAYNLFAKTLKEDDPAAREVHIQALDGLAKHTAMALEEKPGDILANQSAMYMGVWHRLQGRDDEARIYFRPYVRSNLQLLSDDDPDNDQSAWFELAHVLARAGLDSYARAILYTHHNVVSEDELSSPVGDDSNEDNNVNDAAALSAALENRMATAWHIASGDGVSGVGVWYCDGCRRSWGNWTDARVCRYCQADLCSECFGRIGQGDLAKVCHVDHDWLYITAPEKVAQPGNIYFENRMMSFDEFKALLAERIG